MIIKANSVTPGITSKQFLLFLLILIFSSRYNTLHSQNVQPKPTRQSAVGAFSRGDFEKACGEFKELLVVYPKDQLYKYYTGACLVNLKRNSIEAESLLKDALQSGVSSVKSLPADARFYLGRSQQMSGKFGEAIVSYNQYTQLVGKKIAKEMGVPDFVQQCNEKKGKVDSKNPELVEENKVTAIAPLTLVSDTLKNTIPAGFEKQLDKLAPSEKSAFRATIAANEAAAASWQKSADQKYDEAQAAMNPQMKVTEDSVSFVKSSAVLVNETKAPANAAVVVTAAEVTDNKQIKTADNQQVVMQKAEAASKKQIEVFSVFEVLDKPVTDPKEKVSIDPVVPPGLIYRIQIAVFRNPVAPVYFKGVTPINGFKLAGTDKTIYYAGLFRRSADASKALTKVKAKGFKDAFVVALSNKKTVSADRAAALEKEWGKKPLMMISENTTEAAADTVPPTLSFRVEVMRSAKPLKDDVLQGITKMSGSRGIDNQIADDGKIVYLIGKFITFESAAEYADLLVRNGYKDSKVVAWLGKKELPLETAKKLFDDLK